MDKSIVYYFDVPCDKAPKVCKESEKCESGKCVTRVLDLCKIVPCPKDKVCVKGVCVAPDACSKCKDN